MSKSILAFVMMVLLTACAPTTGLVQTGPDSYALTQAVTRKASLEEKRTMSLYERSQKYIKPIERELEAEGRAKCARENAAYEYVATRISHRTSYGPYYTLNFKCIKAGVNHD